MPKRNLVESGPLVYDRINKREAAVLENSSVRVAKLEWNGPVDGISDFASGLKLPAGAVPVRVLADVITADTTALDAILKVGSSTIVATLNLTVAGLNDQSVTLVKLTEPAELNIDFQTAATGNGVARILVEYIVSE